jgi:hypothetical protein
MRHDVGSLPAVRVNVSPTRSTVCYRSVTTSDSSNSSPGGDRAAIHPGYDPPISAHMRYLRPGLQRQDRAQLQPRSPLCAITSMSKSARERHDCALLILN